MSIVAYTPHPTAKMVTLTVALEDMKTQLAEVVRGAFEKGFELVAGVVGAKLAKSMEGAVKNAEVVGKGGGYGDMAGLREQIKGASPSSPLRL